MSKSQAGRSALDDPRYQSYMRQSSHVVSRKIKRVNSLRAPQGKTSRESLKTTTEQGLLLGQNNS